MAKKNKGCKQCGTFISNPVKNESGEFIFWLGAYKGTKDFSMLMSNFEVSFLGIITSKFPDVDHDKYDYYCTDCFSEIAKEQHLDCECGGEDEKTE